MASLAGARGEGGREGGKERRKRMLGFRSQTPWSGAGAEPICGDAAAAVVAARKGMETPLTAVAEAFEELARRMEADGGELRLGPFGDTCALVSVLFSCLGMAFRFAEIEYVAKVNPRPSPTPLSISFVVVVLGNFIVFLILYFVSWISSSQRIKKFRF